jgi:hypothetical protein
MALLLLSIILLATFALLAVVDGADSRDTSRPIGLR